MTAYGIVSIYKMHEKFKISMNYSGTRKDEILFENYFIIWLLYKIIFIKN